MDNSLFYQKYLVVQISRTALQELLYQKLRDLYAMCGQHTGNINSYSYKLSELIPEYHSELTWAEVETILQRGKDWKYGAFDSVTVRLIMTWLKEGKETILRSNQRAPQSSGSSMDWIRFIKWCNQYEIPENIYEQMTVEEFKEGKYEGKFKRRRQC